MPQNTVTAYTRPYPLRRLECQIQRHAVRLLNARAVRGLFQHARRAFDQEHGAQHAPRRIQTDAGHGHQLGHLYRAVLCVWERVYVNHT